MTSYQKHEFCKDVKCPCLVEEKVTTCPLEDEDCVVSAKVFHTWLKKNSYMLLREEIEFSC